MLAGIIMDVVQLIHDVCRVVDGGSLLGEGGKFQTADYRTGSSLPNHRFAGVKPVVS
jgi:hypothetical protein